MNIENMIFHIRFWCKSFITVRTSMGFYLLMNRSNMFHHLLSCCQFFITNSTLKFEFFVLNFLSILSDFLLREKLTKKELELIKLPRTSILPNCKVTNGYFCIRLQVMYLQLLSFCLYLLILVSFSLMRKFKTQNSNLIKHSWRRHRTFFMNQSVLEWI